MIAEMLFAVRAQRLAKRLEAEGGLPDEELPVQRERSRRAAGGGRGVPALQVRRRAASGGLARLVPTRPRLRRERRPPTRALGDAPGDQALPRLALVRTRRRSRPRRRRCRHSNPSASSRSGTTFVLSSASTCRTLAQHPDRPLRSPDGVRAMQAAGQRVGDAVARRRRRPGEDDGAAELRGHEMPDGGRLVVEADPRPVLSAGAEAGAEADLRQELHGSEARAAR